MVLGDAFLKLETFVWILNHISRSITWSLFILIASFLVKWPISTSSLRITRHDYSAELQTTTQTNLNMIFHVVVSVYRLVKIWNSPQFPDEFRNGQWWRGNAQSVDKLFCVFRLALLLVTRCKWFYYILNFDLPHCGRNNREFKQIATAGATTAAVTEKVWGEF